MRKNFSTGIRLVSIFLFLTNSSCFGFSSNQFLVPFLNYNRYLSEKIESRFAVQPFILRADSSFDCHGRLTGLFNFEMPGYDFRQIDKALIASGRTGESLLRTDLEKILVFAPYFMEGKLDVRGIAADFYAPMTGWLGVGGRWSAMQVNSRMELCPDRTMFSKFSLGPGDERELILTRERAHRLLDLEVMCFTEESPGDLDVYLRFFTSCEYEYKTRFFETGLSIGGLFPFAEAREINNPASISAGNNGHFGIYLEGNLDAILKEDLRAGVMLRFEQLFSRRGTYRVPALNEPMRFGSIVGEMNVNPGFTFAFYPYLLFERLRGGFGGFLGYTLVKHFKDKWVDIREDQTVPSNLNGMISNSDWGVSHVRIGALYDFSEWGCQREFNPVLHFMVDVPVDWLVGRNSFKTYGFSLIAEITF